MRTAAILIAVVAVLYLARAILIPLAFAITLSLILAPAVALLQKARLGRSPAVLLVMAISMAGAGAIGLVIFNELVDVANQLPNYQENIHNKIQAMHTPGKGAFGHAAASVQDLVKQLSAAPGPAASPASGDRVTSRNAQNRPGRPLPVQIVEPPANYFEYLRDLTKPFLAPLGVLGIVLIFSLFLLIEQNDLRNRLFRLAGLARLNVMTQALDDATHRISRYLLMQLLVNASFGLLCGSGLYLIGVPYAVLWGAVAGLLRIVPYVGSVAAACCPSCFRWRSSIIGCVRCWCFSCSPRWSL